uniref:Uncharacterized protein n=1 Tax=Arundo donax TaxID=35708 RepID=A0A0A9AEQ9_ARUDO
MHVIIVSRDETHVRSTTCTCGLYNSVILKVLS